MWNRIKQILLAYDVELVEVLFGIQSFGTSFFSLLFLIESDVTNVFLTLSILTSIPQIYGVYSRNITLRHWTNLGTSIESVLIAWSLVGQGTDGIAIAGYSFLGIACFFCFWRTDITLKEHGNN